MAKDSLRATLIGGHGFIGTQLFKELKKSHWDVLVFEKNDQRLFTEELGHVFYCAGLTADFRQRPFDTVQAHISDVASILQKSTFQSLTYLSSTRVYTGASSTKEDAVLQVNPTDANDLYNLSKLMGESICLQSGKNVRVVRLSNVYGSSMSKDNFLAQIIIAAKENGKVIFQSGKNSAKDYISISEVVKLLPLIALQGKTEIYNLASGVNVSNAELMAILNQLGVQCDVQENAKTIYFLEINIEKLKTQFGEIFGEIQMDLKQEFTSLFNQYGESI